MAYKYKDYTESDAVTQARDYLAQVQAAKPGDYTSVWQGQIDKLQDQILNRKGFTYQAAKDPLYQQYKDSYTRQGKLAQQEAQGQAAALTGGYGSSYGQQVGQQTFQQYMQGLNDKIPELASAALAKYQADGDNMRQNLGLLTTREQQDYGRYQDALGNWQTERGFAASRYDTERDTDYTKYLNDRSYDWQTYQNAQSLALDQVNYYLNTGRTPPAALLEQAGLDPAYANMRASDVQAAIAAQQAAAAQLYTPRPKDDPKPKDDPYSSVSLAAAEAVASGKYTENEIIQGLIQQGVDKTRARAAVKQAALLQG